MSEIFWNERYKSVPFAYGKAPNAFLEECLTGVRPGAILFPCEGEGRNAVYAARLGWRSYAFDFSEEARKHALSWADENKVKIEYDLMQAVEYIPERMFDCVALIYAHYHDLKRAIIHQRFWRSVVPGGILILEAFHTNQMNYSSGGPKDPQMLYSLEKLTVDFPKSKIIRSEEAVITLSEGSFHKGEAAVVRLLLEKTL